MKDIKRMLQSVLYNSVILGVLFILFEPTAKSDDYDMCNILYGGINGEYSPFILYSNVIFGYILKLLMNIFPGVSWFYICQYTGLFISFCTITYIVLKKSKNQTGKYLYLVLMAYAGYEFYIRFTFSKTAGVMLAVGFLYLLYLIEKNEHFCIRYFHGIGLIFIGIMIRSGMFQACVLVFISSFFIFCYDSIRNHDAAFKGKVFRFVILTGTLFLVSEGLAQINGYIYNTDKIWGDYNITNTARANLVDFGVPDYEQNQKEYEAIGVSKNDYMMWFQLPNRGDPDILTIEKYKEIRSIHQKSKEESIWKIIDTATKNLLRYQISNTMFYLFLSCGLLLLLLGEKDAWIKVLLVYAFCTFAYYYLSYKGRLQHHVDASVYFTGSVILLYYLVQSEKNVKKNLQHAAVVIVFLFCLFINNFHYELSSSSYYGVQFGVIHSEKEKYMKNYETLSLLSDDKEHLYVVGARETNRTYPCFTVFEVIEREFYRNIYRTNMDHIPISFQSLKKYGAEKLWDEIVNHEIYYCVSQEQHSDLSVVLEYIREHYHKQAYMTLVKHVGEMWIYRFNEGKLFVDLPDVYGDSSEVISSVDIVQNEAGEVKISGYAYIDGVDSYSQNIYIEEKNNRTGKSTFYYTLQEENPQFVNCDKYHGRYSYFQMDIDKKSNNSDIYLILQNKKKTYRIQLQ